MIVYFLRFLLCCIYVKIVYMLHIHATPFSCLPPSLDFTVSLCIIKLLICLSMTYSEAPLIHNTVHQCSSGHLSFQDVDHLSLFVCLLLNSAAARSGRLRVVVSSCY